MMDKNREAFEAELVKWWPQAEGNITRDGDDYTNHFMSYAWWGWKTSRQAIEVELPEEHHSDSWLGNGCCDDHANTKIAECRKALTSLGIRVKGNEE